MRVTEVDRIFGEPCSECGGKRQNGQAIYEHNGQYRVLCYVCAVWIFAYLEGWRPEGYPEYAGWQW